MKKTDLSIIILHWLMATSLIGVSITGLLYKFKSYCVYFSWIFLPAEWMGATHIWLSIFVVIFLSLYLFYLKQANPLTRLQVHLRVVTGGQIRWKYVTNILYWLLFFVVLIETISGVLLTKLINAGTLLHYFWIPRNPLIFVHYYLVWFIFAFPALHMILHWLDGGRRKLASIFQPAIFPRRPSLIEVMTAMKEENTRLKAKVKANEPIHPRSNNPPNRECGLPNSGSN